MSAYDYRPGTHSSPLFDARRNPQGLYQYLVTLVDQRMQKAAFANAVPGQDYVRAVRPGTRTYGFMDGQGRPFTTNVFREIMGPKYGTLITARYNHYPGENRFNPIALDDHSKPCKAVLALGCPSFATEAVADLWHDQLCSAVELQRYDRVWEEEVARNAIASGQKPESFLVKEFVKNTDVSNLFDPQPNCMLLIGPVMYTTPPQGLQTQDSSLPTRTAAVATREGMKRRRLRVDGSSVSTASEDMEQSSGTASTPANAVTVATAASAPNVADTTSTSGRLFPRGDQIFVGATYDPSLQYDYGGAAFNLVNSRLVQPDFRDTRQRLICPWDFYDKLRPGTIVIANIDIAVYLMNGRKTYHANILSLRILGESDVPVERPRVFVAPNTVASGPSAESFNSFSLPDFSASTSTPVSGTDSDISTGNTTADGQHTDSSSDTVEGAPVTSPIDDDESASLPFDSDIPMTVEDMQESVHRDPDTEESGNGDHAGSRSTRRRKRPPPTHDSFISFLDPVDRINFGRCCKDARRAVKIFERKAYHLQLLYGRYFGSDNHIATFQRIQRDHGVLVSGSTVVAFLDHVYFPEADLDVYANITVALHVVEFLEGIGYAFHSRDDCNQTFYDSFHSLSPANTRDPHEYGSSIAGVLDFRLDNRLVQVIVTVHGPMDAILKFYGTETEQTQTAISKWERRGWSFAPLPSASDYLRPSTEFSDGERCVGDRLSWIVPLRFLDDAFSPDCMPSYLLWLRDPIRGNSWYQSIVGQRLFVMSHVNVTATHLRREYTANHCAKLIPFAPLSVSSRDDPLYWDKKFADIIFNAHGFRQTPVTSDFHGDLSRRFPVTRHDPTLSYSSLLTAVTVLVLSHTILQLRDVLGYIPEYSISFEKQEDQQNRGDMLLWTVATFVISMSRSYTPTAILALVERMAQVLVRVHLRILFRYERPDFATYFAVVE
ncbi:hypothetical protein VKT23_002503 [Stygiomarasmius scandens]|uniref:Uncharacterized protein n=1 Tax=Marasmiellus scandens TaxID=2682957 RepID=A0ABR1K271_9AGAR